jgi:hypothetical protein
MAKYDALYQCQPDPGAVEVVNAVQSLKDTK